MKKYSSSIFFYLFLCYLIYLLINQLNSGYGKDSWQITEWLINYQGGFVRRGLKGEILLFLYNKFDINTYRLIIILSLSSYFILVLFFVKSFYEKFLPIFVLPLVFFLGAPIINNFWVRTDTLILCLFVLSLPFAFKNTPISILVSNFVIILAMLIHEAVAAFSLPFLIRVFYVQNIDKLKRPRKFLSAFYVILQLSPAILSFLLCLIFNGNARISYEIWNSWKGVYFPIQSNLITPPAAIEVLSNSLNNSVDLVIDTFRKSNNGYGGAFLWVLFIVLIYYTLSNMDRLKTRIFWEPGTFLNREKFSRILLFQLFGICPLFLIGIDYGRWIFLWVSSATAIYLTIPAKIDSTFSPKWLNYLDDRLLKSLDKILGNSSRSVYLSALLISITLTCDKFSEFLEVNPVFSLANFVIKWLFKGFLIMKDALIN